MPTYATLFKHTTEGKQGIDSLPELFEGAMDGAREMGLDIHAAYYGNMGEYDGFTIYEAPDGKTAETFRLAFEREGTHHFETYEIFEPETYFEMIGDTTN